MKNLDNYPEKHELKNWDKIRKLTFVAGICVLLATIIVILFSWQDSFNKYYYNLSQLQDSTIKDMQINKMIPSTLGLFWRGTLTFTWISNMTLGITLILFSFYFKDWKAQRAFYLAVVYITITFIVYWVLVFPVEIKDFKAGNFVRTSVIHATNPIVGFVFLFLNRKQIKITHLTIWASCAVVLAYYFFSLITFFMAKNATNFLDANNSPKHNVYNDLDIYIYDFLNFEKPLFYKGNSLAIKVLLNILIVVIGLTLTPGLGYMWKGICRLEIIKKPRRFCIRKNTQKTE